MRGSRGDTGRLVAASLTVAVACGGRTTAEGTDGGATGDAGSSSTQTLGSSSDEATTTGSDADAESSTAGSTGREDECSTHQDCPPGWACEVLPFDPARCVDVECIDHEDCEDGYVCHHGPHADGGVCQPTEPGTPGFGYPVGDKATWPAGGWFVTQVLGHYLDTADFKGGHLAQDIAAGTEAETANAPVYAIGDGEVLYAGPNASTYVNVVLVRHDLGSEGVVCSFYGHLGSTTVTEGQRVARGDQIATVLDWAAHFGPANSHLHYVVLSEALCMASDAADGALICGYDDTASPNGIETLGDEPYSYTSVGDPCGTHQYPDAFISPSQFIEAHHF